jgi:MFS family permease
MNIPLGCTIICFLSPLGADLSFVADEVSDALNMDMLASSFSLLNSALAAAGIVGPLFVGWLQQTLGWRATSIAMGILCLSGALPCVSTVLCSHFIHTDQSIRVAYELSGSFYWEALAESSMRSQRRKSVQLTLELKTGVMNGD